MKSSIVFRLCLAPIIFIVVIAIVTTSLDDFSAQSPPTKTSLRVAPKATVFHPLLQETRSPALYTPVGAFEAGIVYPRWGDTGYGSKDAPWQAGLTAIHQDTNAAWIEMPLVFSQPQNTNSAFDHVTPSLATFTAGILAAHARGYHIFVIPLLTTRVPGGWANLITFDTDALERSWFDTFEHLYSPYMQVAQSNHVEQLSLGTEAGWLQNNGSVALWSAYIAMTRRLFSGKLTYDTNWGNLGDNPPSWFSQLDYIGVSEYIPLASNADRIDPRAMPALWKEVIGAQLDSFAARVHKMLILSEIGYRNSSDALFEPWRSINTTTVDQDEQAGAVNAAMIALSQDTAIHGTFFWGWDDVGAFTLQHTKAASALKQWYTKLQ